MPEFRAPRCRIRLAQHEQGRGHGARDLDRYRAEVGAFGNLDVDQAAEGVRHQSLRRADREAATDFRHTSPLGQVPERIRVHADPHVQDAALRSLRRHPHRDPFAGYRVETGRMPSRAYGFDADAACYARGVGRNGAREIRRGRVCPDVCRRRTPLLSHVEGGRYADPIVVLRHGMLRGWPAGVQRELAGNRLEAGGQQGIAGRQA